MTGRFTPVRLNPDPVAAIWLTTMLEELELVIVSERDLLLPTVTVPKLRLAALADKAPVVLPGVEG